MTVRELVQMLILNCDLDDNVVVETKQVIDEKDETFKFVTDKPKRVFHIGCGESVIECHEE